MESLKTLVQKRSWANPNGVLELSPGLAKPTLGRLEEPEPEPQRGSVMVGLSGTTEPRWGSAHSASHQPRVGFANPGLGSGTPLGFAQLLFLTSVFSDSIKMVTDVTQVTSASGVSGCFWLLVAGCWFLVEFGSKKRLKNG